MIYRQNPNAGPLGWWRPKHNPPEAGDTAFQDAIHRVNRPIYVVDLKGKTAVCQDGTITIGDIDSSGSNMLPLVGYAPALHPRDLGDPTFRKTYNLDYPYVAGAMANGITSVEMVREAGHAGMIGFFGAAGLLPGEIEAAIHSLKQCMGSRSFGFNLIHSPTDPELEKATVKLYIEHGINLVSASAFLDLTLPLVYYRVYGIHSGSNGKPVCPNRIMAKVSRVEIARKFFAPPPEKHLKQLVAQNLITSEQAQLATAVPMADDLTAEADSGGHTDNRPALTLLPTMLALRDEMAVKYGYDQTVRVGLAGGHCNTGFNCSRICDGSGLCSHRIYKSVLPGSRHVGHCPPDAGGGRPGRRGNGAFSRHV